MEFSSSGKDANRQQIGSIPKAILILGFLRVPLRPYSNRGPHIWLSVQQSPESLQWLMDDNSPFTSHGVSAGVEPETQMDTFLRWDSPIQPNLVSMLVCYTLTWHSLSIVWSRSRNWGWISKLILDCRSGSPECGLLLASCYTSLCPSLAKWSKLMTEILIKGSCGVCSFEHLHHGVSHSFWNLHNDSCSLQSLHGHRSHHNLRFCTTMCLLASVAIPLSL